MEYLFVIWRKNKQEETALLSNRNKIILRADYSLVKHFNEKEPKFITHIYVTLTHY